MRTQIAAVALFFLSLTVAADENSRAVINNEPGFVAEKVYQFDGLDSVNLFNGNLTLTLPLGGSYPVSSNLSYGLKLYYNSKVWELTEGGNGNTCSENQPDSFAAFPTPALHARASAGLGWTFSLGTFVPRSASSANTADSYISPDGATHRFGPRTALTGVPGYTAVAYTFGPMHLRLKVTTAGQYEIEFPDGTMHTFGSDGFILRMTDRFDNAAVISNAVVNGTWFWFMQDAHRLQTIRLKDAWNHLNPDERFEGLRWIVESIDLAAFSTDGSTPIGRYEFEYSYPFIARGCGGAYVFQPCTGTPQVPLLQRLKWVPDGSTFQFAYNTEQGSECQQGTLSRVTLPTGGAIGWTYGTYQLPANGCWNPFTGTDWRNRTVGVKKKTLYDENGAVKGEWAYKPELGALTQTENMCGEVDTPTGPITPVHYGYQQVTNTVTDPVGRVTIHYFASWNDDVVSTANNADGNFERDYGLPFTRLTRAQNAPGDRFLSRKICTGTASACNPLQTIYLQYDDAASELAPRLLAEHTVFNLDPQPPPDPENPPDDPAEHYVDSASSDYDGFGHYRQTVRSSSFGPTRTTFVNYSGTGPAIGNAWLLNRYTSESVTEPIDGLDHTSVSNVCIDEDTGVLLGKRWLRWTVIDPNDVVVRYEYEGGDPVAEDWYGGDKTAVVSNDLCATSTEASQYRVEHDYTAGVRATSQYRNATFKSRDVTVHARTGLASANRDSAGAASSYEYDQLGRLTAVRPKDEAWTHYTYVPFTAAAGQSPSKLASVIARTYAATVTNLTTSPAPVPLTERRIYYDALGRVLQTRQRMPVGWSVVNFGYDAAGQRTSVSMPEARSGADFESFTPANRTVTTFDRLGRVKTSRTPDGKTTMISYIGSRRVERTVDIGGTNVRTREDYDAHGRLVAVTENAGSTSHDVTTSYRYDVGNRLTEVSMPDAEGTVTQTRKFVYDNRGFLLAEVHPEKGPNGNGLVLYGVLDGPNFTPAYDARGHLLRKIDGTTLGGKYDLTFTYDQAERLTKVEDLDSSGARRVLKQFDYGTANVPADCPPGPACNALNGKLQSAIRNNYVPNLGAVPVTETYEYKSLGGRPTRRETVIGSTTSFAGASFALNQTWDENGFMDSLTYPATAAVSKPRTVTFGYADGLLTGVDGYASITYQPNGLIDTVTHQGNVTETWTADPHGMARPRRISVAGPSQLTWTTGDYSFDGTGNITGIGNWSYSYDAMNRLVSWNEAVPGGYNTVRRDLDAFGNYRAHHITGCVTASSGRMSCYFSSVLPRDVDENNHYTLDTYDDAGSVIADGVHTYGYDAVSMMTSLTGGGRDDRYLYTADDERIALIDRVANKTTWTLRGTSNQLLRTFTRNSVSTNTGWSWTEDEVWRGSQLLASESPSGTKQYHLDHLGSPRFITNVAGGRVGEQTFSPFGLGGTSDGGRVQFTGHEADNSGSSQGLMYMHARYYSGELGRFLSVDPARGWELRRPQSWNRYAYASNNPVNRIDPDGKKDFAVVVHVQQVIDPNQVRGGNAYQRFNLQHPGANTVQRPFYPVAQQASGDFKTNNRLVIRGDVTNSVVTIKSFAGSTASLGQTHVGPLKIDGEVERNTGPQVTGSGAQVQVTQALQGHINPFLAAIGGSSPISIGSTITVNLTGQGDAVQTDTTVSYSAFPTTFVCTSGTQCDEKPPVSLDTVLRNK